MWYVYQYIHLYVGKFNICFAGIYDPSENPKIGDIELPDGDSPYYNGNLQIEQTPSFIAKIDQSGNIINVVSLGLGVSSSWSRYIGFDRILAFLFNIRSVLIPASKMI